MVVENNTLKSMDHNVHKHNNIIYTTSPRHDHSVNCKYCYTLVSNQTVRDITPLLPFYIWMTKTQILDSTLNRCCHNWCTKTWFINVCRIKKKGKELKYAKKSTKSLGQVMKYYVDDKEPAFVQKVVHCDLFRQVGPAILLRGTILPVRRFEPDIVRRWGG